MISLIRLFLIWKENHHMPILLPDDMNIQLPEMTLVRQKINKEKLPDLPQAIRKELSQEKIKSTIFFGQKIAVAVGSRGINQIDTIVKTVISYLKEHGAEPFIVAAMGSHGGGTEQGRQAILSSYSVTAEAMGVPVYASPDVKPLGRTASGLPIYMQAQAYDADAIVLINRIKAHDDFSGPIESGLCKMAVIGLGSHIGCTAIHKAGIETFHKTIPEAAKVIFQKKKVIFGLAIVENALQETHTIKALPGGEILDAEPALLKLAKQTAPKLLIPKMDILILEEIGKDISGAGFDAAVLGRFGPKMREPDIPQFKQFVILGLSAGSHGNAIGIGYADITLRSILDEIDFESTYGNCFACLDLECGHLPILLETEREAICGAVKMTGISDTTHIEIVRIKNTAELEFIQVSTTLLPFIKKHPDLFEILS